MKIKYKILYGLLSVILLAGFFLGGVYFGYDRRPFIERISGVSNMQDPEVLVDFEPFWKAWKLIDEEYADAKDISSNDRLDGAIKGLVSSLGDPYSVYFPSNESKDFQNTIKGNFEGIGMEVGMKNKVLTIIAPLKGTPADKAGLRSGDMILKINDVSTSDMSVDKAVSIIRGPKGTPVKLAVYREGDKKPREISVIREVINIPTLDENKRDDGTYVISLYNFSENSALLFAGALEKFVKSGSQNLIIDLRGNPGGYLEASVNIASMFLPEGDIVVSENSGKAGEKPTIYRSKGFGIVDPNKVKIVILVDEGSASASEILAGALREHGVATLIGETTYGKGSVQVVEKLTDETLIKLTIAKWYTPKGVSISKKGIHPDIEVTISDKDLDSKKDLVLERAVEFFKNGK